MKIIPAVPVRVIDVVCGVIRDGRGMYLACLRPQGKHLGGCWEFPGGKIDPGEAPEIALMRELREELAIEVAVGEALEPVICHYETASIRLLPFLCEITGGVPLPLEHEQVRWCAPQDFDALTWAEADIPILREIQNRSE